MLKRIEELEAQYCLMEKRLFAHEMVLSWLLNQHDHEGLGYLAKQAQVLEQLEKTAGRDEQIAVFDQLIEHLRIYHEQQKSEQSGLPKDKQYGS